MTHRVQTKSRGGFRRQLLRERRLLWIGCCMGDREGDPRKGEKAKVLCDGGAWNRTPRDDLGSRGINRRDVLALIADKIQLNDLSRGHLSVLLAQCDDNVGVTAT
ncbi:hypothetical protein LSAT2_009804 [Lamellibrachia satsuma]|nr:hypothetical protein LSAT2_009804 [Lamellibrachia satsuma]